MTRENDEGYEPDKAGFISESLCYIEKEYYYGTFTD